MGLLILYTIARAGSYGFGRGASPRFMEKERSLPLAEASGGWGRRSAESDEPVLVEGDGVRLPRGLDRRRRGRDVDRHGRGLLFDLPRDGLHLLRHCREEGLREVVQD